MKKLFFTLCLLNAPCFSMDLKDSPSVELVTQQQLHEPDEQEERELLLNNSRCARITKKLRKNACKIGCCFAALFALMPISIFMINNSLQKPVQPQVFYCVSPQTQIGNLNWIARVNNCGKCEEWGTYGACPSNVPVNELYKRLNSSQQQFCPDARGCIDLFESTSCIEEQPEWFFDQLEKSLNKTCKIKAD